MQDFFFLLSSDLRRPRRGVGHKNKTKKTKKNTNLLQRKEGCARARCEARTKPSGAGDAWRRSPRAMYDRAIGWCPHDHAFDLTLHSVTATRRVNEQALAMATSRKLAAAKAPHCRYRGGGRPHTEPRSLIMIERVEALVRQQNLWIAAQLTAGSRPSRQPAAGAAAPAADPPPSPVQTPRSPSALPPRRPGHDGSPPADRAARQLWRGANASQPAAAASAAEAEAGLAAMSPPEPLHSLEEVAQRLAAAGAAPAAVLTAAAEAARRAGYHGLRCTEAARRVASQAAAVEAATAAMHRWGDADDVRRAAAKAAQQVGLSKGESAQVAAWAATQAIVQVAACRSAAAGDEAAAVRAAAGAAAEGAGLSGVELERCCAQATLQARRVGQGGSQHARASAHVRTCVGG